jgi:hypothetical protein
MTHDPLCLCEQCIAHDPMCPVTVTEKFIDAVYVLPGTDLSKTNLGKVVTVEDGECACALIARVREDEQWQASEAVTNAWNVGYLHGLSAARKAVTKLPRPLSKIEALAAIDALRGDA